MPDDDAQAWAIRQLELDGAGFEEGILQSLRIRLALGRDSRVSERVSDFKQSRGTRPSTFCCEMAAMNRLADDTFTDNEIGSQLIDDNLLLELKSCTRSVFKQANDVADRDTARDTARPESRDEGLVSRKVQLQHHHDHDNNNEQPQRDCHHRVSR